MSISPAAVVPPTCMPHHQPTSTPRYTLPAGATDCHCHVFEDPQRWPLHSPRSYTPSPATREDYLAMCRTLGLERTVQVSASVYGYDNSLTLDVIADLGQDRARGVAGLQLDTSAAEIEQLHAGGMRGTRVSTALKGYGGADAIPVLAKIIRPFGWHLQLHFDNADELVALEPLLLRTEVPLVFDHMASVRGSEGCGNPGFQALLRILAARDDCWVKISSWQRRSDSGTRDCRDFRPIVQALVAARPDRMLFGTNWPNPSQFPPKGVVPDDADSIDQLCEWVPEAALQKRLFTDNAAQLYGFAPV